MESGVWNQGKLNITTFINRIPTLEFILKKIEIILIDIAIKSHKKSVAYSRDPETVIKYLAEYKNSLNHPMGDNSILPFDKFKFKSKSRYTFIFDSPYKPLNSFEKDYEECSELHKARIHYYPFRYSKKVKKVNKAIIYLHGWGKNSLRVEENWHFYILRQIYKTDIYALELPYHMNRNPKGFSGQGFLDADPVRTIEAFRQSVHEVMLTYKSLKSIYQKVGIVGISLGGHIAAYSSLLLEQNIFIMACLAGTPFSHNLENLNISPNLVKSLGEKQLKIHSPLNVLDFTNIPLKHKNELLLLFGGKYDSVIDSESVLNLGKHLQCETTIVPTGHFTFAFSLPYLTLKYKW